MEMIRYATTLALAVAAFALSPTSALSAFHCGELAPGEVAVFADLHDSDGHVRVRGKGGNVDCTLQSPVSFAHDVRSGSNCAVNAPISGPLTLEVRNNGPEVSRYCVE